MSPAERVRSWCRIKGVSVRDLARRTGLSRAKVGRIVAGRQVPTADDMEVFAGALGLTMTEIYGEKSDTEEQAAS